MRVFGVQVDDPAVTADALRTCPIGEDARGSRYYVFAHRAEDCRVYREDFQCVRKAARKAKPVVEDVAEPSWVTVCSSVEEVSELVAALSQSKNPAERQLHRRLANDTLPELLRTEKARRRAEERADMLEKAPLKRSSRIQELTKRREEEGGVARRGGSDQESAGRDELGGGEMGSLNNNNNSFHNHNSHNHSNNGNNNSGIGNGNNSSSSAGGGGVGGGRRQDSEWARESHLDMRRVSTGPSREERMRLRNERKERAERGEEVGPPANGGVGTKRRWCHAFGWNPVGPDVKCTRKKRVQRTKAPRSFRKLEDLRLEEFGAPDEMRKAFHKLVGDPAERSRLLELAKPLTYQRPNPMPLPLQRGKPGSSLHQQVEEIKHWNTQFWMLVVATWETKAYCLGLRFSGCLSMSCSPLTMLLLVV